VSEFLRLLSEQQLSRADIAQAQAAQLAESIYSSDRLLDAAREARRAVLRALRPAARVVAQQPHGEGSSAGQGAAGSGRQTRAARLPKVAALDLEAHLERDGCVCFLATGWLAGWR
jgi:hypothetical protein